LNTVSPLATSSSVTKRFSKEPFKSYTCAKVTSSGGSVGMRAAGGGVARGGATGSSRSGRRGTTAAFVVGEPSDAALTAVVSRIVVASISTASASAF
jgi:hypothetical protein